MGKSTTLAAIPMSRDAEEAEWVRAAKQNPAQFKKLYTRWVSPVYQYLLHRVRNTTEAEDLTSQVFLKAYEQLPKYRHKGCFSSWLFTIARNTANDHFRKLKREAPGDTLQNISTNPDMLGQAILHDELHRLIELIHSLPEQEQELIRLRYVAGLTYREIGEMTNRSEDAVRKSLARLLHRLQVQLETGHA